MGQILGERLRLQVEMALSPRGDDAQWREQELRARRFGMTGAEIDAARRGGAHDVRAAAAVALALAVRRAFPQELAGARQRALRSGLDEAVVASIEALAQQPLPLE